MGKARITYRFDRNGHREQVSEGNGSPMADPPPYAERQPYKLEDGRQDAPAYEGEFEVVSEEIHPAHDTQLLNQFTTDFGAWSSPFDAETEKLERIIRESDRSVHDNAHADKLPVRFDHGPEEGPMLPRFIQHAKPPWHKLLVSFAAAVATGAVLGFLILSLFNNDRSFPDYAAGTTNTDAPTAHMNASGETGMTEDTGDSALLPWPSLEGGSGEAGGNMASDEAVYVALAGQSYYLLQIGVFSTVEGAEAVEKELRERGFAAFRKNSQDEYVVYAGLMTDRDDALWLGHRLQQLEFETYIKPYELPPVQQVRWGNTGADQLQPYFEAVAEWVRILADVSVLHLQKEQPTAPENETMEAVIHQHRLVSDQASAVTSGAPEDVAAMMKQIETAMDAAMVSLEEYRRNPSASYQWQIQEQLMRVVLIEEQVLETVRVN